jgi:hypothetical protein
MGYAVLHINKGCGSAKGLGNHNDRKKKVLNADEEKQGENLHIIEVEKKNERGIVEKQLEARKFSDYSPEQDLQTRINERIKTGYKVKKEIRKDAVRHIDVILSGSHKDMKELEKDRNELVNWACENYRFVEERFGKDNIVGFTVHLDERTPHIHATVVPITKDGRLSAKELMGDRRSLSSLQTKYAERMEKYGLERGIVGSTAKHTGLKEFYGQLEAQQQKAGEAFRPGRLEMSAAMEIPEARTNFLGNISQEEHQRVIEKMKQIEGERLAAVKAYFDVELSKNREQLNKALDVPGVWQRRSESREKNLQQKSEALKTWIKNAEKILEGKADRQQARKLIDEVMIKQGLKVPVPTLKKINQQEMKV